MRAVNILRILLFLPPVVWASGLSDHPADVDDFIDRREICDHFRGEEPYDAERAEFLAKRLAETCSGTDRELRSLKQKYGDEHAVLRALERFEDDIEGGIPVEDVAVGSSGASVSDAAPPTPPAFVLNYLDVAGLEYDLPRGRFDEYLLALFLDQNKRAPWSITADFTGDGTPDWAGLLRNRSGHLELLAVYSAAGTYAHKILTPLGRDDDMLNVGVVVEPPGELVGFPVDDGDRAPRIKIRNSGAHLFYFEKSSVLYYWNGDDFGEFLTSD